VTAVAVKNPPDVVERLVRENRGLVPYLARSFNSPLGFEELIAEGNVGLVIAAQRYDATRGVKFSTCAAWWIRARIKSAIERESGCGKSRHLRKLFGGMGRAYHALADNDGHASSAAIAEFLDIDEKVVEQLRMHVVMREVRLDASYAGDPETTIADKLLLERGASPEDEALEAEQLGIARDAVLRALAALPRRDRYIIEERWLGSRRRTKADLALELGVSRERVRQVEMRALKRMRRALLAFARRQERIPSWCDA